MIMSSLSLLSDYSDLSLYQFLVPIHNNFYFHRPPFIRQFASSTVAMTNLTHSDGHGAGYGNITLLMNPHLCTLDTCDLSLASFEYLPTVAGNTIYAVIFGILLFAQLGLGIKFKTWGYMVAVIFGLVCSLIFSTLYFQNQSRV